jgi:uncharacterized protein YdeI (YjbR/CyaY-like superfamily)
LVTFPARPNKKKELTHFSSQKEKESFKKSLPLAFQNTFAISFSRKVKSLDPQKPELILFQGGEQKDEARVRQSFVNLKR